MRRQEATVPLVEISMSNTFCEVRPCSTESLRGQEREGGIHWPGKGVERARQVSRDLWNEASDFKVGMLDSITKVCLCLRKILSDGAKVTVRKTQNKTKTK